MAFVMLGVLLVALKLLEYGPPGQWSWWLVLAPFAAAYVWWTVSDMTGYTQRRALRAMEDKKTTRRMQALAALGMDQRTRARQKKDVKKKTATRSR